MEDYSGRSMACYTNVEVIKGTYTWSITNFSYVSTTNDKKLKSSIFSVGEEVQHKWRLRLYPYGSQKEKDTHLSLFLQLVSTTAVPVIAKFTFFIVKANGERQLLAVPQLRTFKHCMKSLGYDDVLERSQLLDSRNGMMLDDCLKIVCELGVCKGSATSQTVLIDQDTSQTIMHNLRHSLENLLLDERFSDVTLRTGYRRFRVHKAVLSVRSPVFAAMFEHDMHEAQESEVLIEDVAGDVLEQLLRFVYTGRAEKLDLVGVELYRAADKYALEDLKLMCERSIVGGLKVGNAVNALMLADRHNDAILWEQAVGFMRTNAVRMVDNFAGFVRNARGAACNK